MKYNTLFFTFLLFLNCTVLSGQEINYTDQNGLKQGVWEKRYPNGKLMYQATFKDSKPTGTMNRYFESGEKRATLIFDSKSEKVHTIQYYENGLKSAEGNFINLQKDSIWNFYSFYDGGLISTEVYSFGKKNGVQKTYYPNGKLASEIGYNNGIKEGVWNEYFDDGKRKSEARYQFNMLNGKYVVFQPGGALLVLGYFSDDTRHGTWKFYDTNGVLKYEIVYQFGKAENNDILLKQDEDFFKMVDENIGKIEEPSVEDFFPGGGM